MMTTVTVVIAALLLVDLAAAAGPSVLLRNAARSNVWMPVTGLGTGQYGNYFNGSDEVVQAVSKWLQLGGGRIDTSLSYGDQVPVGAGIKASGIPREKVFITSKVGPFDPLGFNDTLSQFDNILKTLDVTYVDLLLIHWPGQTGTPSANSTDPACGPSGTPRLCRQSTWAAMQQIFESGKVNAIGVSNFETNHLQDIFDMKGLIPSVNQVEFHPYWHEDELLAFCKKNNILFNGYSPLGAPDEATRNFGWDLRNNTVLQAIAKAHTVSVAQVMLRWEYEQGMVVNPRTKNPAHMAENLNFFSFGLTAAESAQIAALTIAKNPKICPDPNKIP